MTATSQTPERMTGADYRAVFAATLGWAMDAFDYFIVILVYADIAADFDVSLTRMAFLTTVTLLMRPVGAAIFGIWADKVGRKKALIVGRLLLQRRRIRLRVRAELHGAARTAPAVRHRHGRRVGPRRVAVDGEGAAEAARPGQRHRAAGLRDRLPVRGGRVPADHRTSPTGAGAGCSRCRSCPRCCRCSCGRRSPSPRYGRRPARTPSATRRRSGRCSRNRRGAAPAGLPRAADDRLQLDEPRDAGHLPDLPEGGSALLAEHRAVHRDALQRRRAHRRHAHGCRVGEVRPARGRRVLRGARAADHAAVRGVAHRSGWSASARS